MGMKNLRRKTMSTCLECCFKEEEAYVVVEL